MTEYWVSQAKHWCTYCKQWISANKHEIKRHEEGRKHKEAVQEFFKKKRESFSAYFLREVNESLRVWTAS